jgi:hypothetical protein
MKTKFEVDDIVRTKNISVNGVFKDKIKSIDYENGIEYINGSNWRFPSNEMEIIRKKI